MKKFGILDKCNGCGICSNMTDLILEDSKGIAYPAKDGFISEGFLEEADKIVAVCPTRAIFIKETGNAKSSGKSGLNELQTVLKNKLIGIQKPNITKQDIKFNANNYNIDYASANGQSDYRYSGESQAERAGLDEFNRIAYSQYRPFILSVFVQYKNDKLKPFYTFDEKGFYVKNNKQYEDILKEILGEAKAISNNKISIPDDFIFFKVLPGGSNKSYRENVTYGISNFELQSTQSGVMAEFKTGSYSSLDSYKMYIDTDDMEMYEGEDWRGRTKYKTKYCYRSVYDAINEFIKDLKSAMNYADIDESAMYFLEGAITSYNNEIDNAIEEKIKIFTEALSKL